jgi:hypothetical protein
MPVLIDDDLIFEDGPGRPRPVLAVNRWLTELPVSGAPSPNSWAYYARVIKAWMEFVAGCGIDVFDSREALKAALGKYAGHRAAGPVKDRFVASTWNQHVSVLGVFYRWAISEGYASAEPFTYRGGLAVFAGTGRPVEVNLARRRMPGPHVSIKYLEPDFAELFCKALASMAGSWPATLRWRSWRWPPGCGCRSSATCWCGRFPYCRRSGLPRRSRSRCRRG